MTMSILLTRPLRTGWSWFTVRFGAQVEPYGTTSLDGAAFVVPKQASLGV